MNGDYHPTLWRTARVLANRDRLDCLREVLAHPGASVEKVAEGAGIRENKASLCLRALQSRGLLRARRESRWVYYSADTDPLVPSAAPILSAMRRALAEQKDDEVFRALTAFTHPRRLVVLKTLQTHGSMSGDRLSVVTSISPPALRRHLLKLTSRRLVSVTEEGVCTLANAHCRLCDTFLALIAAGM
jgi:DNA-binding transcriptional ArsR family regulator